MSQDDRIGQLTDLFIQDLRGPVEASLRQLVAQMMGIAAQEQAAALAALRSELDEGREREIDAVRGELTERHGRELDALRTELADLYTRQLEAAGAEMRRQHEDAMEAAVQQAAAEGEERLQAFSDQLLDTNQAALAELTDRIAAEREAAARAARDQMAAEHASALATLRETLEREHAASLADQRQALERERGVAFAASADGPSHERDADLAARLETSIRERDAARATIGELTDQLAAATAQRHQLTALADAESVAAEQLSTEGADVIAAERQYGLECGSRLVDAIRRLDGSRSLTEVLGVLTDHVGPEDLRVAVLLVQGTRLRAWRLSGLGDVPPAAVDIPLDRAGFLGRAVETGDVATTSESPVAPMDAIPAFMVPPPDRVGLALPVLVGGRVVAVVYADDATGGRSVVPSNWPEMSEVVVRHAGRCLEALTLARANGFHRAEADGSAPIDRTPASPQPAAPAVESVHESLRENDEAQEEESARRHARLLISEIKLYNEALVEQGRRSGNLLGLLGAEIDRARRLYEEKIPAAVRERVQCFDDELVRTLAGGDRALLGQIT